MKVSFSPGNIRDLKSFFKMDVNFLDVYVTQSSLFLISNTTEVYSHKEFEVLSREEFTGSVCFRVDRKQFLSLLSEGVVSIYVGDRGTLELTFKPNGRGSYSVTQNYQASDLTSISDKLAVLSKEEKFSPIKLRLIEPAMRLIKGLTPIINVIDGTLVASKNDVTVYYKTKCQNFNMYTNVVQYLLDYSDGIYGYQNYIVGRGEGCVIIARQVRSSVESDFEDMYARKYSHSVVTNILAACELAKRCGVGDAIVLDFEREVATIEEGRNKFSTKIKVVEVSSAKAKTTSLDLTSFNFNDTSSASLTSVHNIPTLIFPIEVVRDMLSVVASDAITFKLKRTFVQIEISNEFFIAVGRRDFVA
jgi:hypothetical protein